MAEAPTDESPKYKILLADRADPFPYFDFRAKEVGGEIVYGGATTSEEIVPMVEDADVVVVFRQYITADAIARMKKVKLLLRQGIGFDLIDVPAATKAGIFVSNIPDYCIDDVATHAMALLLASVRNIFDYHEVMTRTGFGEFNHSRLVPELGAMTCGVCGLGKIGRAFVRKAQAFGMEMIGYDPYVYDDVFEQMGVKRILDLDEFLKKSNIVSLHMPLTAETKGMFGEREFKLMPRGSFFVNTARGKVVDLTALNAALESGHIAAAGLDVFEEEPLNTDHPILQRKNLIATPHIAFYSERSIRRVLEETMNEINRVLTGSRPKNLVNPEVYAYRNGS